MQTTTINCLTGVVQASGGDALVYGETLSSPGGVDRIRSIMGVCPQFDVLWSELTGTEHLHIYGNIKVFPCCSFLPSFALMAGSSLHNHYCYSACSVSACTTAILSWSTSSLQVSCVCLFISTLEWTPIESTSCWIQSPAGLVNEDCSIAVQNCTESILMQ